MTNKPENTCKTMTIREIREQKQQLGYTNELLSELSGVPLSTVQKVLSGITKSPRLGTLQALSKVFAAQTEAGASSVAAAAPRPDEPLSNHWFTDSSGFSYVREASVAWHTDQKKYTIEDLEALPDGVLAELMDGNLYFMCAPSTFHQEIAGEMYLAVANYIRAHGGKCKVFIPPFAVNLFADDTTSVLPDLTVICDTSKINARGCHGAPDWVVEVLSPSTTRKDCGQKLYKYRRSGVKEYWIIYPDKRMVTVYLFAAEDENDTVTIYSFEDSIPCSLFPDLKIRLADYL